MQKNHHIELGEKCHEKKKKLSVVKFPDGRPPTPTSSYELKNPTQQRNQKKEKKN
jgi:hypothetical protein